MLTEQVLEEILSQLPDLTIGVLGDLFLDRYLEIDAALTEPSLETGLDAYQVVRVRPSPGAAGTVINNVAALGVKQVVALSVLGDDGEGYELRQALGRLADLGQAHPERFMLADSRQRIGFFQDVTLKPNRAECLATVSEAERQSCDLARAACNLARRARRPVFCTLGKEGVMLVEPTGE